MTTGYWIEFNVYGRGQTNGGKSISGHMNVTFRGPDGTARAGGGRRAPQTAGASLDCPIRATGMQAVRAAGPDAPAALRCCEPPEHEDLTN